MKQAIATVISQTLVTPGVSLVWLESPEIAQLARPGQFVMVKCGEDTILRRPFSIYKTDDSKDKFAILYARVGKGTTWLSEQKANSTVDILGPLGNGFTIHPESHHLLLIAGGMGIAPLNFLAIEAVNQGLSVTLLCGTPTRHRYPPERLPKEVELVTVTEDGSIGKKGMITDILPDFTSSTDQVFACGPLPMYRAMAKMPQLKNRLVQISLEVRMGCGLGICYGCTVKTRNGLRQACKHGPIFNLDDVLWDELTDI